MADAEFEGGDVLATEMAASAGDKDITYVAFTATPVKTLDLFAPPPEAG